MRKVKFYIDDMLYLRNLTKKENPNLTDKQVDDIFCNDKSFRVIYTLFGEGKNADRYALTDYNKQTININDLNDYQRGCIISECNSYFDGTMKFEDGEFPTGVIWIEDSDDKIIDGKALSIIEKAKIKEKVKKLNAKGVEPKLSVIIIGNNSASQSYVRGKHKDCAECGIISENIALPENVTQVELLEIIKKLNDDKTVDGILVQLPLPKHIDEYAVINAISPTKDVDGFTVKNTGNMFIGQDCFLPCTPQACMDLLDYAGVDLDGKDICIIGRSNIVGKPTAILAMQRNATITICHSKTKRIADKTRNADVIIVAVGKEKFLTKDMVKSGAIIIDVGINRGKNGKICGDVDFFECVDLAKRITPVPGGVGLMTRVNLLKNTIKSAERRMQ